MLQIVVACTCVTRKIARQKKINTIKCSAHVDTLAELAEQAAQACGRSKSNRGCFSASPSASGMLRGFLYCICVSSSFSWFLFFGIFFLLLSSSIFPSPECALRQLLQ